MTVTLFGNRIFIDVINLRWNHTQLGQALNLMTGFLTERFGDTVTQERRPFDYEGRDWSDASTNQWMPGLPPTTSSYKEARMGSLLESSRRAWPSWHLDFRLLPSKTLMGVNFCYLAIPFVVMCYSSSMK